MVQSRLFRITILALTLALILLASTVAVSSSTSQGSPVQFLAGAAQGDPLTMALNYISDHVDVLGLTSSDVADMVVTDRYTSPKSGITHIYFRQRYAGIDVYNALLNVNVARDGSVINVGNRFVPDLSSAVNTTKPAITPLDALRAAARSLGLSLSGQATGQSMGANSAEGIIFSESGLSSESVPFKLIYQPMPDGAVRLAWDLSIDQLEAQSYWSMRIDAVTGRELHRANLVDRDSFGPPTGAGSELGIPNVGKSRVDLSLLQLTDQYMVYAQPLESPSHGERTLVTGPADASASPYGWHDIDGFAGAEYTLTRGNNVYAYEAGDNYGFSPDGSQTLTFDFALDLGLEPDGYEAAAITNLFYWNNLLHDVFYHYGFDEAAGNFQENNYGHGGAGGDSVNAEAQDSSDINNAAFYTPADGANPRMEMYLWNTTTPMRDGDLDNGIIAHEFGHGISNRLTGGPSAVTCLDNVEQPGEGWSDFISLMMTMDSGDTGADPRGIGTYALGQPPNGPGIRDYPYSTVMAIDPRTYDEIKTALVPHGVGSTWTAMLWDVAWAFIDQYGYDPDLIAGAGGNNMALQLVIDGLTLQPCSPGFVDGRDAILLADQNNNGGANQCLIWEAFARRGLGYSASQGSPDSRSDGVQAFDVPPACLETLKITQSADPSPAEAGSTLTYSLLVENDTLSPLTDVTITDNVPVGATYVPGSADCGGSEAGGLITFPLGNMASGASQTCSFQVTVDSGLGDVVLFQDDMESGAGSWDVTHDQTTADWTLATLNANSPDHAWYASDVDVVSDQYLAMVNPIVLSGQPTLRFWHDYNTEANYDGGVVEMSVDGGQWTDLGPLINQNGYNGVMYASTYNPIAGRHAFTGDSGGYLETAVDLEPYTGSSARVRFRLGTDITVGLDGWYVDDVTVVDEARLTNTACVTAAEGDDDCDTLVTRVNPAPGQAHITVNPAALAELLAPDLIANAILDIGNAGSADLSWSLFESPDNCATAADVSWLSTSPASGLTGSGGLDAVTVVLDSYGLSAGVETASICISSNDPDDMLVEVPVELTVVQAPAFVDQYATADMPVAGTVTGTFEDTHDNDGIAQTITERQSGGKPSNRHDYLSHVWSFQLTAGSGHTFYVNAWQLNAADADEFVLAYSTDNSSYVDMESMVISGTGDGSMLSYELPANLSGTLYVQVSDNDQTPGLLDFDTVNIDQMFIRTSDPGEPPPSTAMHVHAFSGDAAAAPRNRWDALAHVTIYEVSPADDTPIEGAMVTGVWSGAASGDGNCTTLADGTCTVSKNNIKYGRGPATFTVTGIVRGGDTYDPADNHVTSIDISQP